MPRSIASFLLSTIALALGNPCVARATTISLRDDSGHTEVCRFSAGRATNPFERWLTSQDVTCVAAGTDLSFPKGLWNVFARSEGRVSSDPTLVDGAAAPEALTISMAPAATIAVSLAASDSGVLYAPRRVTAFPAMERTIVPAGEELWLFVVRKSVPVALVVIPPTSAGSDRAVDARSSSMSPSIVGWAHLADADRAAVLRSHGVLAPRIRVLAGHKETDAMTLPSPELLDGAFVVVSGLTAGEADLQLGGRGWLPFRHRVSIRTDALTLVRQAVAARAAATIIVKWSTFGDLAALDRSFGSCEAPPPAPQLQLVISSCVAAGADGSETPSWSCHPIRNDVLSLQPGFGEVTVDEATPGLYKAEIRFGRLPPVALTQDVAPLQSQPMILQASYHEVYGSLTRGGQPLSEDVAITFPGGGAGFKERGADDYHAVLTDRLPFIDARIDIATCRGQRSFVLTDKPMPYNARFDIDVPDNMLTISVVDTFTRAPLDAATVKMSIMSLRMPFRPVVTRTLAHGDDAGKVDAERPDQQRGPFVLSGIPERQIRLQTSNKGYKTRDADPFTMSRSEKKIVEIELLPLVGSQARIISSHPFESGTIFWFSAAGVETERADLAPDGTFVFEHTHLRDETMTVVSASHPLWISRATAVERGKLLEAAFPVGARVRSPQVSLPSMPARASTIIGIAIGGLRVPEQALAQHLALRHGRPFAQGGNPLFIPALVESGPIDVLRGPTSQMPDATRLRDFAPAATERVSANSDEVVFGRK